LGLVPGSRLGPYEILAAIGAGGMGEVYRARDIKLNRDVALKVLPDLVADDPDRRARFEREAQALAALNHPHIAHIYGAEESVNGVQSTTLALVMELVEGQTLADVLTRGPLPVDEAVAIARQVADALEAAHAAGIVHRDLKPANIKVRPDNVVKVLDFGLARIVDVSPLTASAIDSPTVLSPGATVHGVILGTAAYMAPEQARGKTVDKRADIWAFGVVLYEMLTGRRLFDGSDASEIIAAVLRQEIDWTALPDGTAPVVRHLLTRCLERDVNLRLRDIGEARILLTRGEAPHVATTSLPAPRTLAANWTLLLSCVACLAAGATLAWWLRGPAPRPTPLRLSVAPPVSALAHSIRSVHISPDGARVVYWDDASPELLVRDFDSFESRPLAGTEGGRMPFFSPDGEWVGFYAEGKLRKVPVKGGDAIAICDAPTESPGADWSPDGTIYFSPTWTSGLWKVSSAGGQPSRVTAPDETKGEAAHFWPRVLPDGRHILFTIFAGAGLIDAKIGLLDAQSGRVAVLLSGSRPVYAGHGRLAFYHGGGYHVVPFDESTGTVTGSIQAIEEPVRPLDPVGASESYLDIAANGRTVYVPGGASRNTPYSRIVWIDRGGHKELLPFDDYHQSVALAPDGRRAAVTRSAGGELQVWIYDLERGTRDQLTRDGLNFDPHWSPDGARVAYTSVTKGSGSFDVRASAADGSGPASVLLATDQDEFEWSWLPDGHSAVFTMIAPQTGKDVYVMTDGQPQSRRPVIATSVDEELAEVSPDGRFILWVSAGTLYAARYPSLTNRLQLAVRATTPHWSGETSDVLFAQDGRLVSVPYQVRGDAILAGSPVSLFAVPRGPTDLRYSVSKDGQRFLMLENDPSRETAEEIRVLDGGLNPVGR
jgi:serine/threonine-protein kinase